MEQRARVSSPDAKTMNPEATPTSLRRCERLAPNVTVSPPFPRRCATGWVPRSPPPLTQFAMRAAASSSPAWASPVMWRAKIAATLASTGTPAFFVHAADASHGDLGMITSDDVMLALSWSGETEELKDLITYSRRFRITLIAITASAGSTLGTAADIVLALPESREACPHNLAPTTSSLMQLALGDALAIALLESRGFTALDFGVFHPRGKLGAALKFTRDVMHAGPSVPQIKRGAPMSEAIVEMTSKGFGCVAVVETQRQARRCHHRWRFAPAYARRPASGPGRRGDDRDHPRPFVRINWQAKRCKSSIPPRSRRCLSWSKACRSGSCIFTICCARASRKRFDRRTAKSSRDR